MIMIMLLLLLIMIICFFLNFDFDYDYGVVVVDDYDLYNTDNSDQRRNRCLTQQHGHMSYVVTFN